MAAPPREQGRNRPKASGWPAPPREGQQRRLEGPGGTAGRRAARRAHVGHMVFASSPRAQEDFFLAPRIGRGIPNSERLLRAVLAAPKAYGSVPDP